MCRLNGHSPSSRSQLDLNDLKVKTYCRRCGAPMIRIASKWQAEESLGPGAAWMARGEPPSV